MLKLEKSSQLSDLKIRFKERDRFFEPRLLQALALALILHGGALLIFQVTPFHFSTFLFPPIQVQSEYPIQKVSILASALEKEEEDFPPLFTLIPVLDWLSPPQESLLLPSLNLDPSAFQFLEERIWPKWYEPLSLALEEPFIKLTISGDLATLPLITTDPLLFKMSPISSYLVPPLYVTYQVQVDERTGEIFWYERLKSSDASSIDQITETILLNLRFSLTHLPHPIEGFLNFTILNPYDSDN